MIYMYSIYIYIYTGGKMKSRLVHTQNMRHTPPAVSGRHLSLWRPGESGFVPLALLLLACWMTSCKAVTARAGLCRSALPWERPGSRARFLAVTLSHGMYDMTTAGFSRGNRPMQVVEPFGLTIWELNWLQSGVQALGGRSAQMCLWRLVNGLFSAHGRQGSILCCRCLNLFPFLRSPSRRSFTGFWLQENSWYIYIYM